MSSPSHLSGLKVSTSESRPLDPHIGGSRTSPYISAVSVCRGSDHCYLHRFTVSPGQHPDPTVYVPGAILIIV